jgi:hypothetical protein
VPEVEGIQGVGKIPLTGNTNPAKIQGLFGVETE